MEVQAGKLFRVAGKGPMRAMEAFPSGIWRLNTQLAGNYYAEEGRLIPVTIDYLKAIAKEHKRVFPHDVETIRVQHRWIKDFNSIEFRPEGTP
jgi:hypothetical protein